MKVALEIVLTALGLSLPFYNVAQQSAHDAPSASASANRTHPWLDPGHSAKERVAMLMANMTLSEKLSLMEGAAGLENHGVGAAVNPCIGLVKVPKRLGIPNLCMGDGPSGVSNGLGNVTTFPAPIVISSSWDANLMYDYAKAIAKEHRGKGHNVALTPTINIQRAPLWGRNAESFSEDSYLTSELAVASVMGTQSEGILASVKHLAAYNQETNRFGDSPTWSAANVVVSNRTLQEVYLPAFKAVVERAQPGSVMTSYNKVNGLHASEHPALLGDLFSWGFDDGFTVTDWYFGHRSTVAAALAGQTVSMPGGKSDFGFDDFYSEENLLAAIDDNSLPFDVVEDMVRRVLTPMFIHGLVDHPNLGFVNADVRQLEHHKLSVRAVEEGTVLLRNAGKALPIGPDVKKIAVIGPGGDYGALVSERYGGFVGSPNLNDTLVTPLQGIRARAGSDVSIGFAQGYKEMGAYDPVPSSLFHSKGGAGLHTTVYNSSDWTGTPILDTLMSNTTAALGLDLNETISSSASAMYRGHFHPEETGNYTFTVYAGGYAKLFIDVEEILWLRKEDFVNYATGQIHLTAGEPVTFQLEYSAAPAITSKGLSLTYLPPSSTSQLYDTAVEAAESADVAIVFVGNILSEGGDGTSLQLAQIQDDLVRKMAQASSLLIVVAQTNNPFLMPWLDDVDAVLLQWYPGEGVGTALASILFGDVNPSGKLAMTFPPADDVGPTSSRQSFPGPNADAMNGTADVFYDEGLAVGYKWFDQQAVDPLFPFGHGLSYTSFNISGGKISAGAATAGVRVQVELCNTGDRAGKEVVQLYVGYPELAEEPPKLLKGFQKVYLETGSQVEVTFDVAREQLMYWSEKSQGWDFAEGQYTFYVGTSSQAISWNETVHMYSA